jgi:hypothetical protein
MSSDALNPSQRRDLGSRARHPARPPELPPSSSSAVRTVPLCRPRGSVNQTAGLRAKQPRFSRRQPLGRLPQTDKHGSNRRSSETAALIDLKEAVGAAAISAVSPERARSSGSTRAPRYPPRRAGIIRSRAHARQRVAYSRPRVAGVVGQRRGSCRMGLAGTFGSGASE